MQYVVFLLDEQQFGLDISFIERVLSIVEVTSLPNAPEHLLGAIDIHGDIVPIINLRQLMGIQIREIDLSDQLLICNFQNQTIGLWVDRVSRITDYSATQETDNQICSKMKGVQRVIEENGKFIFLIEIDQLLGDVCKV